MPSFAKMKRLPIEKSWGVESAPSTAAVAVIVLIAAPAHLLPEAHGGAELLEDHAHSDPSGVVVELGDGQAATEGLEVLQLLGRRR